MADILTAEFDEACAPHLKRWQEYERDYILPLFRWAAEDGFNLQELVHKNPGKNCAELYVQEMRRRVQEAESNLNTLEQSLRNTGPIRIEDALFITLRNGTRCYSIDRNDALALIKELRAQIGAPNGPEDIQDLQHELGQLQAALGRMQEHVAVILPKLPEGVKS